MILPRRFPFLWLGLLLTTAPLHAQLTPLTVPRGLLRLDFGGRFDNWDQRFLNGRKQDAAGDFIHDPLDGSSIPALAVDQAELRRITGVQALTLSLGRSTGGMLVNLGTANLGAAYGVSRRLTLFGNVPIVRIRVQNRFGVDSTEATAGFNPLHPLFGSPALGAQTASFLGQLETALSALASRLNQGIYDGDPAQKAAAQAALATGNTLRSDLSSLFGTATFLPLAGSAAAGTITTPIESLRGNLVALGVTGFQASPGLPTARIGSQAFEDYATNPDGPLAAQPFEVPILQYLGDIEVGAGYAWLDRRPGRGGLAVRSVLLGTVRLRTGKLDRPDSYFDLSTGDRQPDIQGDLVTDMATGGFGVRVLARYVYQLPGRLNKRITPPDQPFPEAGTLAALERDPGDIVEFGVEPFLRIGPTLALSGGVRRWSKGQDTYRYVTGQTPIDNLAPEVLALDSKETGTLISAGLSFSPDGRRRDGSIGLPMDAFIRFEQVVGSTLGRVPVRQTLAVGLRLYRKMF